MAITTSKQIKRITQSALKLLSIVTIFLFSLSMTTATDDIIGVWEAANKDGTMEFYKVGDHYNAKMLSRQAALAPDGKTYKKDTKNPDPNLRNRGLKGIEQITNLKFEDGAYVGGKIYDFGSGGTYDCKVTISGDQLSLRAYQKVAFLGKTIKFNRLK